MKNIIMYIIVSLILISCGDSYKDVKYSGYVYDAELSEPIEGMYVGISADKDTDTFTDGDGYYYAKMNVDCVYETSISAGNSIYATENFTLGHTTCDNQKVKHDFYLDHKKSTSPDFHGVVYLKGSSTPIESVKIYLSNSEIIPGNENEVLTDVDGKFLIDDYINYVTDLYIHAEKAGYISAKVQISVDTFSWVYGEDIYLELE
jgi:hypothetical protein